MNSNKLNTKAMNNNFTEEEITAAKETRSQIIMQPMGSELKAIYMAGEICMWDELNNTPSKEGLSKEEVIKQIAWKAWQGAANAHRLYPDNNHTFTSYWESAKNQFKEYASQFQPDSDKEGKEIAFLDWSADNYFERDDSGLWYKWMLREKDERSYTTQQLYTLFLKSHLTGGEGKT